MNTCDKVDVVQDFTEIANAFRKFMNTEYTEIWKLSDFLLDAASYASDEQKIKIHQIHKELSPNEQRTVVPTSHAEQIMDLVVEILTENVDIDNNVDYNEI